MLLLAGAGCKTELATEVNLSDLISGQSKLIQSDLYVEVPS